MHRRARNRRLGAFRICGIVFQLEYFEGFHSRFVAQLPPEDRKAQRRLPQRTSRVAAKIPQAFRRRSSPIGRRLENRNEQSAPDVEKQRSPKGYLRSRARELAMSGRFERWQGIEFELEFVEGLPAARPCSPAARSAKHSTRCATGADDRREACARSLAPQQTKTFRRSPVTSRCQSTAR